MGGTHLKKWAINSSKKMSDELSKKVYQGRMKRQN
jgi:hypothetical protein